MDIYNQIETALENNLRFFNEFLLCEQRIAGDVKGYYDSTLPDETDAKASNAYRRTFDILLYLISKKNIIPGFEFHYYKNDVVAYNSSEYCFYGKDYDTYSDAMENFLASYGWHFPSGWNTEFFPVFSQDDYEFAEEFLKKEGVSYTDVYLSGFLITFRNNMFDKVYQIRKRLEGNSQATEEYERLWSYAINILFDGVYHHVIMYDTYIVDEKNCYFSLLANEFIDAYECIHQYDIRGFLNPLLFFQIPILDDMMKKYINKWEREA